ncbi:MAG: N-6 DNA methylase [Acidobacteria bacterium]|jgi:type I restriction enzyme M protein|nr:N-6 DNA methylase [Acidobacteriota bacterium]
MEPLGRFYTTDPISQLLVSRFSQDSPRHILDIGAGDGSLLNAAYNRWQNATFHAADIDPASIATISLHLPFVRLQKVDGLSPGLNRKMSLKVNSVDIAICNPPYLRAKNTNETMKILREAGFLNSLQLKRLTSDIIFLAQNLLLLKEGGELGIILPDSIFSGHEFTCLREDIITNNKINAVIQLPDKIFSKTEARTHILLLEKNGKPNRLTALYQADNLGKLTAPLYISMEQAVKRMDYSYYCWKNQQKHAGAHSHLGDLGVEIKRGRSSKKVLQNSGIKFFHTSSFPVSSLFVKLESHYIPGEVMAESGDILISRVGKRCIGRVAVVESGAQVISDCVYRLRTQLEYKETIWKALVSPEGKQWFQANAHGVCARCLSKKNLLTFPISL